MTKFTKKKIIYNYVCSLYLVVQFYYYYLVCCSENIIKPENYDKKWFRIIKCKTFPINYIILLFVMVKMDKNKKLLLLL